MKIEIEVDDEKIEILRKNVKLEAREHVEEYLKQTLKTSVEMLVDMLVMQQAGISVDPVRVAREALSR